MLLSPIDGQDVSASQLLMNQTFVSSGMLLCLIPFFDRVPVFGESERRGKHTGRIADESQIKYQLKSLPAGSLEALWPQSST